MTGIIRLGRKTIHSSFTLMQCFREQEGVVVVSFADKNSNDMIKLSLDPETVERIYEITKKNFQDQTPSSKKGDLQNQTQALGSCAACF